MDEYEKYYFKLHPRAYKRPFEKPWHHSINQWMIMQRQAMNGLKQKYKDWMVWFVKYVDMENLMIDCCTMKFKTYFPTRARHDTDNFVPKFILDGMVEAGFIVDDDSSHLQSLTLECGYDKENPRTEITINILK